MTSDLVWHLLSGVAIGYLLYRNYRLGKSLDALVELCDGLVTAHCKSLEGDRLTNEILHSMSDDLRTLQIEMQTETDTNP